MLLTFFLYLITATPVYASDSNYGIQNCNFFPYQDCFSGTILDVKKIDFVYRIKLKVKQTVRGDSKTGDLLEIGTYENIYKKENFSSKIGSVNGSNLIIAFNRVAPSRGSDSFEKGLVPVENLHFMNPTSNRLQALKQLALHAAKSNDKVKQAFQCYLENRWNINRIKDYCRDGTRFIRYKPLALNEYHSIANWDGELFPKEFGEYKIKWRAFEYGGVPQVYAIHVEKPSGIVVWQLEVGSPGLEEWKKNEYVKYRVSEELRTATEAYSAKMIEGPNFENWQSPIEKSFEKRKNETLILGTDKKIIGYKCILGDSQLIAKLDRQLNIKKIFVDGKLSSTWNQAFLDCSKNIDNINIRLAQTKRKRG